jgi:TRAP-type C4-dicarboxylate transport system permease small subunit
MRAWAKAAAAILVSATVMAWLCSILSVLVMGLISSDVLARSLTGRGIPGAIEYSEVAMVGLVFLALGYAQVTDSNVGVSYFLDRLPERARFVVRLIGLLAAMVVVAWMAYLTGLGAIESFLSGEYRFGLAEVPVWPARATIPIGLILLFLVMVVQVVRIVIRRDSRVGATEIAPEI